MTSAGAAWSASSAKRERIENEDPPPKSNTGTLNSASSRSTRMRAEPVDAGTGVPSLPETRVGGCPGCKRTPSSVREWKGDGLEVGMARRRGCTEGDHPGQRRQSE